MVLWLTKVVGLHFTIVVSTSDCINIMFITLNDTEGTFNLGKDATQVTRNDWSYSWTDCGDSWNDCSMAFS